MFKALPWLSTRLSSSYWRHCEIRNIGDFADIRWVISCLDHLGLKPLISDQSPFLCTSLSRRLSCAAPSHTNTRVRMSVFFLSACYIRATSPQTVSFFKPTRGPECMLNGMNTYQMYVVDAFLILHRARLVFSSFFLFFFFHGSLSCFG